MIKHQEWSPHGDIKKWKKPNLTNLKRENLYYLSVPFKTTKAMYYLETYAWKQKYIIRAPSIGHKEISRRHTVDEWMHVLNPHHPPPNPPPRPNPRF